MRLKASFFIITFFLIPLFSLFFSQNAYASDYVTYTAPNTLVFNQDTTNCQVPGSSYSVQLWSPSIGSTIVYNHANPSFPVTVDLSTLGLVNGNTYEASEFCAFGLHGGNRDNVTFTYEASTAEAAPVTTISLATQNSDGSYSDPATVTLAATAADGFSVANTYYTLDTSGVQQTYTGPFTVSGPGSHTITYWSVDNNGIQEDGNRQIFTISDIFNVSNVVFNTSTNQMDMDYTGDTTLNGQRFQFLEIYNNTTGSRVVEYINNYGCDTAHCTFTDPSFVDPSNIHPGDTYSVRFELLNRSGINSILTPTFITSTPTPVTAINAGGSTAGDYSTDTDYNAGSTFSTSASIDTSGVIYPAPESVYQSVRYGSNFTYTISNLTANGTYTVQLHFSEPYWGTSQAGGGGVGSRLFNVSVNGTQALSDFDVYQAAGGANKAVMEQIPAIADSNGNITINFTGVIDNAIVNGIAVYNGTLPSPTPIPTPTPVNSLAISAGGTGSGSYVGDTDYTGGSSYSTSTSIDTSGVTNPAPDAVYQNVRYGNFTYTIPTNSPNATYAVRLDFSEPYWDTAGQREFNVTINGTQVLTNFDVYQEAGAQDKAVSETFNTTSDSNGLIHIQFNSVVDNAMVSGIQVSQL